MRWMWDGTGCVGAVVRRMVVCTVRTCFKHILNQTKRIRPLTRRPSPWRSAWCCAGRRATTATRSVSIVSYHPCTYMDPMTDRPPHTTTNQRINSHTSTPDTNPPKHNTSNTTQPPIPTTLDVRLLLPGLPGVRPRGGARHRHGRLAQVRGEENSERQIHMYTFVWLWAASCVRGACHTTHSTTPNTDIHPVPPKHNHKIHK